MIGAWLKKKIEPGDHIDARGHHGRGVDQRAHRRRPLHRVRKPDVERNLRRFPRRADKEQQGDERQCPEARLWTQRGRRSREVLEIERAESNVCEEDPEKEPEIADAVDDEGFLAGVGSTLLLIPKAHQQVRAKADALPAHEHHEKVRAQDEHEHERRKQIQV